MPLTQEPTAKASWPPTGGQPYDVVKMGRFGESFTQIAERKNIRKPNGDPDPWRIIEFNFKTRNPKEVNWYLQKVFKCPSTPDGLNCAFAGGERIFLPVTEDPQPNPVELTDDQIKKLADAFDIDPSAVARFISQYGWTAIDSTLSGIGLLAEAGLIGAASTAIGAILVPVQGVLGFVFFFIWLNRLDQEDQISMGAFAGCFQFADWVVTPNARFASGAVRSPEFPDRWVRRDFVHARTDQPMADYQQERYDQLKAAWNDGAQKMRDNLERLLGEARTKATMEMRKKANGKDVPEVSREKFEDLVKLYILSETGAIINQTKEDRGSVVVNYVYPKIKSRVENATKVNLIREALPYPSTRMSQ